jgi:hypothetical protein
MSEGKRLTPRKLSLTVDLVGIEVLRLYGGANVSEALTLKAGKPGEMGHFKLDDLVADK